MSEKLSEYCRRQASRPCPEDYGFNVEWNLAADDALALEAERDELKAKLEAMRNAAAIAIVALAHYSTSDNELDNVREMLEGAVAAAQEEKE